MTNNSPFPVKLISIQKSYKNNQSPRNRNKIRLSFIRSPQKNKIYILVKIPMMSTIHKYNPCIKSLLLRILNDSRTKEQAAANQLYVKYLNLRTEGWDVFLKMLNCWYRSRRKLLEQKESKQRSSYQNKYWFRYIELFAKDSHGISNCAKKNEVYLIAEHYFISLIFLFWNIFFKGPLCIDTNSIFLMEFSCLTLH